MKPPVARFAAAQSTYQRDLARAYAADPDRAALAREAMESAAARYRSAIRPWARLKLARALLQEALNRFRERAQAPMVSAASVYFSLMTGGAYARLYSAGFAVGVWCFLSISTSWPRAGVIFATIAAFLGLPKFFLKFKAGRRQKKFLTEFPDALDSAVRLLQAGMPLVEALLERGADPEQTDLHGCTAWHLALARFFSEKMEIKSQPLEDMS